MSARLTGAEVDAIIDTLDRTERNQPLIWRKPLVQLSEQLDKAQRVRRWIATQLGLAIAVLRWFGDTAVSSWIFFSTVLAMTTFWAMQRSLEHILPLLDRESRIETLVTYYLSWHDAEEYELVHRRVRNDAA